MSPNSHVDRPLLRYFGGKWRLAPWIISHFPPHKKYTEVFGGAASVLLRKPPADQEIYNDLYDELVTLFQVLRSPRADDLVQAVALTPFSRREFEKSYELADDPVEIARRLIVRSFFGFGGGPSIMRRPTSFRSVNHKSGSAPCQPWAKYPEALNQAVERFRAVVIESRPAIDVLKEQDGPDVLHYVDPPYVHASRSQKTAGDKPYHGYAHEMSDTAHLELIDVLQNLSGRVALSGYDSELYANHLKGWHRFERKAGISNGASRVEALWTNFLPPSQSPSLFETGKVSSC